MDRLDGLFPDPGPVQPQALVGAVAKRGIGYRTYPAGLVPLRVSRMLPK